MDNNSPLKAMIVVTATALVCSIIVTVAAVTLQPIQQAYQDLERIRFIVEISGVSNPVAEMSDLEIITAYQDLDARMVDLESGKFDPSYNPRSFNAQAMTQEMGVDIPADQDLAKLGQRPRLVPVYVVRDDGDKLQRIILPVYGQGMWSTIYGFLALEADLNTIADISFYDQAETAGIGDRILASDWLAGWRGKQLFDDQSSLRFQIIRDKVDPNLSGAAYQVDGLAGATITTNGVTNLIRYWLGPHGFAQFLDNLAASGDA